MPVSWAFRYRIGSESHLRACRDFPAYAKLPNLRLLSSRGAFCCAENIFSGPDSGAEQWDRREYGASQKYQEFRQPLGLYSGVCGIGCRHGQRLGLSEQDGQQWRRRLFADLFAVYLHFQLRGPACGICHGPPGGHRYAGRLRKCLGHPGKIRRKGWRTAGLAAAGGVFVYRYRLRGDRDLYPQGAGGFSGRHPDVHGCRRMVRGLFLHALRRGALPHHCGGGHTADPVPGRSQHRKDQ